MNDNLTDEKAVITECKKDIKAFKKIYAKYLDDVFRYVYVVVRDKDLAEDITSQTFLTAIEKVKKFEWRGISVKYWLIKIAKNLIKKNLSRPKDISLDESMIGLEKMDRKMTEDIVIEEELREKVKELMFKLDDVTREIISLRIWEELKYKEIAKLLDMKQSAVKVRLLRGVERLKQMIEKEAREEKKTKLFALNLAMIAVGIKSLKTVADFLPSVSFRSNFTAQVASKLSLNVSDITMSTLGKAAKAKKVVQAGKTVATGAKNIKVIAVATAAVIILGSTGLGIYAIIKDKEQKVEEDPVFKETIEDETTTEDEEVKSDDELECYESDEYGFKFCYPTDWELTGPEGTPYDYDGTTQTGYYGGVNLTLTKGDWNWNLAYNSYWDDIAGKQIDHIQKVKIYNKDRMRMGYMVWDKPDIIDFFQIYDMDDYERFKPNTQGIGTWEGIGIMLAEGKGFIITYNPTTETTYEDSKAIVEEMDEISKTLEMIEETQSSYEGWKQINLASCDISLYYPSEWYTHDYEYGDYCTRISTLEEISTTEPSNLPLLITVGVFLSEYESPESYYNALKQYPSQQVEVGTKKVDGEDRLYVVHTDEWNHTYYHIFYQVGDDYFSITWTGTEIETHQDKINQLIDSIDIT